jgi:hypothetical protein
LTVGVRSDRSGKLIEGWRCSADQASIVSRATDTSPDRRFRTVPELTTAWRSSLA